MLIFVTSGTVIYYLFFHAMQTEEEGPDYGLPDPEPIESSEGYGISASHPLAVKAGMEVLDNGGNAVDAAIAVSYALGVVEPYGSGIGGGGEMIVLEAGDDEPVIYDYRETAPLTGSIPEYHTGIPGFVKGMEVVHEDFGTAPLEDLIEPAAGLAEGGFKVDTNLNDRLKAAAYRMPVDNLENFYPDGMAIGVNETLEQPELAETLRQIQEEGSEAFYSGELADALLDKAETFNPADLKNYAVVKSKAVSGEFEGYEIISGPPPISGITLIQSLQMAELLNLDSVQDNEADFIHLVGEISKKAYEDRTENIADPAFGKGIPDKLTKEEYAKELAEEISIGELSEDYEVNDSLADKEDHDNTTHFVIVDKEGTMVSATHTLSNFFGSGQFVSGYFLNNMLSNFSMSEGKINSPEPGKRPRSFTTPTIIRNDDMLMGIGTPGGKRIPAIMTQVLIRQLMYEDTLEEALEAPRFYAEGETIYVEEGFDSEALDELRDMGYEVAFRESSFFFGGVQALVIDYEDNQLYGGADPRRGGIWQVKE